jgi:DNA ligase-1
MKAFASLYQALDRTTASQKKLDLLVTYFKCTKPADAAWAVFFLSGGKIRRLLPTRELRAYALAKTGLSDWLFEESYQAVGDLAETISLLLSDESTLRDDCLSDWVTNCLLPLQALSGEPRLEQLTKALDGWDPFTRFVCLKLITSGLRVGVSRLSVTRALATATGLTTSQVSQRLLGYLSSDTLPTSERYALLTSTDDQALKQLAPGQPYPFFLAHPVAITLDSFEQTLGDSNQWQLEWKWDGIRAQWVCRNEQTWLWSRGEELISQQFPEICEVKPPTNMNLVLDGELLVWPSDAELPEPFAALQKRLGRKQVPASVRKAQPVVFVAYDILEHEGQDVRYKPLEQRRALLEATLHLIDHPRFRVSPCLHVSDWTQAHQLQSGARDMKAEGLMLKSRISTYGIGRTRQAGLWFKWKLDPMSVDAVLIYAQQGHGRRASLYTDYTFAVWDKPAGAEDRQLVPLAKAYSGLTDEEIRRVDKILRKSTLESFGPVRRVNPTLVFEIGFEGVMPSSRHKSGLALRFPRMLRWRIDKPIDEADTLESVRALL